MQSRTAVRSISAAALAGGLTLGLGVSAPATAMPVHDRAESLGQLCHAAALAQAGDEATTPPSSIDGLPGLRCGQAFGRAALAGEDDAADDSTEADATETEGAGSTDDETYVSDEAGDDSYESDDAGDDSYESDSGDQADESGDSDDADEADESDDSDEADEADGTEDADEGDWDGDDSEHADHDGDDGGDHSEVDDD